MARSPFCFVHATNVRLDHPLWGLGDVAGDARRLAEDATNLAFERIVQTCLEHDAALLLLTGNTLDAAHGHRAWILLEQAGERLGEQGCRVFIMPGETDPSHAWAQGVHLPQNVTVFPGPQAQAVPLMRDGMPLATVEPYQDRQFLPTAPDESSGLRIVLVGGSGHPQLQEHLAADDGRQLDVNRLQLFPRLASVGYLALGRGSERVTVKLPGGLAHDPGCPQPLDGRRTADAGCTLVSVDADGRLQTRLIPTSVVRREEIPVQVTAGMDWDGLVAAMQTALIACEPAPGERLWLVRWGINGAGKVIDSLAELPARQELAELVEAELSNEGGLLRIHEIDVTDRRSCALDISEGGSVFDEFHSLVGEHAAEHVVRFRRGLPGRDWPEADWVQHILLSAERATAENVVCHGRALARRHLLGPGGE